MVLALARPEVHELFTNLWAQAGVQEIKLPAITPRAAERLVKALLRDARTEVVSGIVARADGNAFHLEELIRHVAEHGEASLPETLLALGESRLAQLGPEARRVLRVASVFGETFWDGGVVALLDDGAPVDAPLRGLVEGEFVSRESTTKFSAMSAHVFRHGLLRDAAYATLTDDDRRLLHVRAGAWLEKVGEKDPLVLADHYERAGDGPRAAPWLARAAQDAVEGFHVALGARLADRAVQAGAEGPTLAIARLVQALAAQARGDHSSVRPRGEGGLPVARHRQPLALPGGGVRAVVRRLLRRPRARAGDRERDADHDARVGERAVRARGAPGHRHPRQRRSDRDRGGAVRADGGDGRRRGGPGFHGRCELRAGGLAAPSRRRPRSDEGGRP